MWRTIRWRATVTRWWGGWPRTAAPNRSPTCLNDPDYGRRDLQELARYRTLMAAPMLLDDDVVGVLLVWRTDVDAFDKHAYRLLTSFAAQAAIVLRQVDLMRVLEARSDELASKVEQLEALRELGDAVSSSLDLDEVLDRIVASAVRLTETDGGSIMEYDEVADTFVVRAAFGSSRALLDRLRTLKIERWRQRSSAGPPATGSSWRSPTSTRSSGTCTSRPCTPTAGVRCSPSRSSVRTTSSARW